MQHIFAKILFITTLACCLPTNTIRAENVEDAEEVASKTIEFAAPTAAQTEELERHAWDSTVANTIYECNINSVPYESRDSSSWTFEEFSKNLYRDTTKPLARKKREYAFNVFKAAEVESGSIMHGAPHAGIDATVWEDLNLVVGQKKRSQYVAKMALPTRTELGTVHSCMALVQPTYDTPALRARQQLIMTLAGDQELLQELQATLEDFALYENILCNFWEQSPWLTKTIEEMNYYNRDLSNFLNYQPLALAPKQLHHLITTASFGALHFLAGLTLLVDMGARICGKKDFRGIPGLTGFATVEGAKHQLNGGLIGDLVTKGFYDYLGTGGALLLGSWLTINGGYQSYQALKSAKAFWLYNCILEKIIRRLAHNLRQYKQLVYLVAKHPSIAQHPDVIALITVSSNKSLQVALKMAESSIFDLVDDNANVLNLGTGLAMMRYFMDARTKMASGLVAIGALDMYAACAENIVKQPNDWCYASYVTAKKPCIDAQAFWHPLIQKAPVKNTLTLGINDHRPHAIITGANAGGKSTAMKALAINVLCAQTLGICPAKSVAITPFLYIKTYLNIKDDLGEGNSLFRAEVQRAQELLTCISTAAPKGFVFTIFDEVFKGTSTLEGPAAALATARHIGRFDNCICLIATHFPMLTRLETTSDLFTNYRVPVLRNNDGTLTHTFKLEPGISQDHIAFDILRSEGFTGAVIDEAATITRSLQNSGLNSGETV